RGYPHHLGAFRCGQCGWPAYQRHIGTQVNQPRGQGVSHFAAGMIADVSYWVDSLMGRSSGNQYFFSGQWLWRGEMYGEKADDLFGFGKSAFAREAAGKFSIAWGDDVVSEGPQAIHIGAGTAVLPHVEVHGRCHEYRRFGREVYGTQEVVAQPLREF